MSLAFPSSRNPAVFLTQKLLCQLPPAAWLEGSCHMCCWRSAPPKAFRHHSCTFIPLLPHRGISELDSDLGHGLGSRDGLLELNIVDMISDMTGVLRLQLWGSEGMWELGMWTWWSGEHQELLLEDTLSLWQQARHFLQMATRPRWPPEVKSWLRLLETLEAPEVSAESSFTCVESCDLMRSTVWGLVACYVSSFIFFFSFHF